jgi:hypothetical protein
MEEPRLSEEARRNLKWRRRKREVVPMLIVGGIALAYWQREYLHLPSEVTLYALAFIILMSFHWVECRLKAMQLRLARMHDRLDELAGLEPQHHVEMELASD